MADRGPSPEWWNAQLSPTRRAIDIVEYALGQVDGLLCYVTDQKPIEPSVVANACTESFLVNVRLVADFLLKPHVSMDLRAVDLVPEWPPKAEVVERLGQWWDLAGKHVMHMSLQRIPEDIGAIQPLTVAEKIQMAADCRELYAAFAAKYSPTGQPVRDPAV